MVLQRTPSNGLFFSQGLSLYLIKTFAQAPSKFQSPGFFFSFLKVFLSSQREFQSPQRHKFCEGDWQNHTQLPAQADMPGLCVLPYYIVRILVLTLKFSVFRRQGIVYFFLCTIRCIGTILSISQRNIKEKHYIYENVFVQMCCYSTMKLMVKEILKKLLLNVLVLF